MLTYKCRREYSVRKDNVEYGRDYATNVWEKGKPHIRKAAHNHSFMPSKMVWICTKDTTFFVGRGETMQEAYDNLSAGARIWTKKKPV